MHEARFSYPRIIENSGETTRSLTLLMRLAIKKNTGRPLQNWTREQPRGTESTKHGNGPLLPPRTDTSISIKSKYVVRSAQLRSKVRLACNI